jgi:hypothetical protein
MYDDISEHPWHRTVWVGLAALAASAVIIGVVVGIIVVGASKVAGVGESASGPSAPDSLLMPAYTRTPLVDEPPVAEGTAPKSSPVTAIPLDSTSSPTSPVGEITLYANPTQVSSGQKINLNGVYLDGEGVALQVQRKEGDAWVKFPTQASVRSGAFDTYVYTGRFGENVFRVFDPTTGRSSNPVSVTVN